MSKINKKSIFHQSLINKISKFFNIIKIYTFDHNLTNILRLLKQANCAVKVMPLTATAEEWADGADLLFFSNGPGDPAALPEAVEQIRRIKGTMPMVGICLGHQLLGLALGAETYKLRFGHRGANHPVRDLETGRVEISSQNHGFCVNAETLEAVGGEVTHLNLNDKTVAGFRHNEHRMMGIQFHPEAAPGPHDSNHLLIERFLAFAGV